jgi:hypothetical protein
MEQAKVRTQKKGSKKSCTPSMATYIRCPFDMKCPHLYSYPQSARNGAKCPPGLVVYASWTLQTRKGSLRGGRSRPPNSESENRRYRCEDDIKSNPNRCLACPDRRFEDVQSHLRALSTHHHADRVYSLSLYYSKLFFVRRSLCAKQAQWPFRRV